MSQEAKDLLKLRALVPMSGPDPSKDIEETRESLRAMLSSLVSAMKDRYRVDVVDETIAGVAARIISTPSRGFPRP